MSGTRADLGGSAAPGGGRGTSVSGSPVDIAAVLRRLVRDVPDYPQPGVVFKDITPLLADAAGFAAVVAALAAGHARVDKVAGIEAATVEVHADAFKPGERVLMIDDVLATGGTAAATARLIRRSGAEVVSLGVLIELGFLGGRARLPDLHIRSLLSL